MKLVLLFLAALSSYNNVNAQLSESAEYAKTKDLKDVKGKVIGKMAVIPGLRSQVVLKSCVQKKDSTGRYSTEYAFVTPNHLEAQNVILVLQFYQSFEEVYFDTKGDADNIKTTIADNKLGTSFQTSQLAVDAVIIITVISKERAFATITGISGQLTAN